MTALLTGNVFGILLSLAAADGQAIDGKKVFIERKCAVCHSVETADVEAKRKDKGVIDLSGLSKKKFEAKWLEQYLQKKEKIEDKVHPTKFKGTDPELKAMVKWLMSVEPKP